MDEETKSYLNSAQDEDAILSSPKGSTSSKSPENPPESSANASSIPVQHKKVVLKRKLLTSISLTEKEEPKPNADSKVMKIGDDSTVKTSGQGESEAKSDTESADGNVAKLAQLTMKERLELRAKKFGAPATGDTAKLARAERFGTAVSAPSADKTSDLPAEKTAPNLDVLKKRAERFGGSVSGAMVKIEQSEKLLKRQERFGNASSTISATVTAKTTTATTTKAPVSTQAASDYAEKAKLRLERFKTTA